MAKTSSQDELLDIVLAECEITPNLCFSVCHDSIEEYYTFILSRFDDFSSVIQKLVLSENLFLELLFTLQHIRFTTCIGRTHVSDGFYLYQQKDTVFFRQYFLLQDGHICGTDNHFAFSLDEFEIFLQSALNLKHILPKLFEKSPCSFTHAGNMVEFFDCTKCSFASKVNINDLCELFK